MTVAKRCGNLYTGSLYTGLASLLSNLPSNQMVGKRVLMFGFGGGCAASIFTIRIVESPAYIVEKMNLIQRLSSMDVTTVEDYLLAMDLRERNHNKANWRPEGGIDNLFEGAYYLDVTDDQRKRFYHRHSTAFVFAMRGCQDTMYKSLGYGLHTYGRLHVDILLIGDGWFTHRGKSCGHDRNKHAEGRAFGPESGVVVGCIVTQIMHYMPSVDKTPFSSPLCNQVRRLLPKLLGLQHMRISKMGWEHAETQRPMKSGSDAADAQPAQKAQVSGDQPYQNHIAVSRKSIAVRATCPPGQGRENKNSYYCVTCQPGTFGLGGNAECQPCPTGSSAPNSGMGSCTCNAGYYKPGGGYTFQGPCTICPNGTFSSSGASYCSFCPADTYSTSGGPCTPCPDGTHSGPGAGECTTTVCIAGQYMLGVSCLTCPSGTYSSAGAISCTPCPAGQTSGPGSDSCIYEPSRRAV
ncbi:GCC2 and GCC3 domain-containing protein [Rhizoctonia solani AG-1 IA]|uniref:GCC2 and GCC3 domain-containing protein n=1 Tax=Thanatephorus cucumeris (strain AG1-IA) TaxID=983506 RepID=L8WKM6_THACA|nr:GCC2 and GCC3 domain-containing protein [Rhizoctonia solani AG-1 IA]